jgi:hypothetical protein
MPSASWALPIPALAWLAGLAPLLWTDAPRAVLLDDASSIMSLMCVSVMEPIDPIAAPVDYSCDRLWFYPIGNLSGPSRASVSTGFSDPLTVSVHTESVDSPQPISTSGASRIKYQLAVAQIAAPPVNVNAVPVSMSTAGSVAVSPLPGLVAGGGTYVSSTESTIFTIADVFAHTMRTTSPAVLADDYDIVQTLDLTPDHVYFANLYAGCNFTLKGTWACNGNATMSFQLDQAAFDARMGGNSFDLSQYFAVQTSPNLVPEPAAALLGLGALGALAGCAHARTASRRTRGAA